MAPRSGRGFGHRHAPRGWFEISIFQAIVRKEMNVLGVNWREKFLHARDRAFAAGAGLGHEATADAICQGYGPQTPRDIGSRTGSNTRVFTLAPPAKQMKSLQYPFSRQRRAQGAGLLVLRGRRPRRLSVQRDREPDAGRAGGPRPWPGRLPRSEARRHDRGALGLHLLRCHAGRGPAWAHASRSDAPTPSFGSRRRRSWWSTIQMR